MTHLNLNETEARILHELKLSAGMGLSRVEAANATGMSEVAASRALEALVDNGLARHCPTPPWGGFARYQANL